MKIKEVAETLERFAPLPLQESYDNAGLQIGLPEGEEVSGVLLCLDVTESIIAEAVEQGCNLIVSHHPLLFRPLRRITGSTLPERCAMQAIKQGVAIYSAHTNLDNAPGGVCHEMAQRLGLHSVDWLQPRTDGTGGSGVIGQLAAPMPADQFLHLAAQTFGVKAMRHNALQAAGAGAGRVQSVALCGGAGAFLIDAAVSAGADAFLTGEVGYHRFFGYDSSLLIGELGHYESERFTIDLLERVLRQSHPTLRLVRTTQCTDASQW